MIFEALNELKGIQSYESLNEAYFGRNAETEAISKNIEELKRKADQSKLNGLWLPPIGDKTVKSIEQNLCKLFGFGVAELNLTNNGRYNANTIPISSASFMDGKNYKVVTNPAGGVKFDKESNILLMMNLDMLLIQDLSPDEVTAIILHEVGHHFYSNSPIVRTHLVIESILKLVLSFNIIGFIAGNTIFSNKFSKYIKKHVDKIVSKLKPGSIQVLNGLSIYLSVISRIENAYREAEILFLPFTPNKKLEYTFPSLISNISFRSQYQAEKFSDNFASAYGYGPELASALSKFDLSGYSDVSKLVKQVPIIDIATQLYKLPISLLVDLFTDVHPNTPARIEEIRRHIQDEANKGGISKRTQALLEDDLDKTAEILRDLENRPLLKGGDIRIKIYGMLQYIFGTFDLRELLFKNKNFDFEQYEYTDMNR